MAATFAKCRCKLFLRMPKLLHELTVACGFFNRIQVSPLNVFNDGDFENLDIVKIANNNRQFVQLSGLSGTPAAFARYDLIGCWIAR